MVKIERTLPRRFQAGTTATKSFTKTIKSMNIQIENLSKQYGQQIAVDHISFEVKTGEVLGFLGPNGAGKSTSMKMITGYLGIGAGDTFW